MGGTLIFLGNGNRRDFMSGPRVDRDENKMSARSGIRLESEWMGNVLNETTVKGGISESGKSLLWGHLQEPTRWPPLRLLEMHSHLLWPDMTLSGGIGRPTQSHNLWPTICLANGMRWRKVDLKIEGVVNQQLIYPKTHSRSKQTPDTAWGSRAQRLDGPET